MHKGLYLIAKDGCQENAWKGIIQSLSMHGSSWLVDCLDCLYETELVPGSYTTGELLASLDHCKYVFSARMIGVPEDQSLDREVKTCGDFFVSNSHSIVLCTDSVHFEVFSKHVDQLSSLMQSLSRDSIVNATWVDESLGGREEFVV